MRDFDIRALSQKHMWAWFAALALIRTTAVAQTESTSVTRNLTWGTIDSPTANTVAFDTALPRWLRKLPTRALNLPAEVGLRNRAAVISCLQLSRMG